MPRNLPLLFCTDFLSRFELPSDYHENCFGYMRLFLQFHPQSLSHQRSHYQLHHSRDPNGSMMFDIAGIFFIARFQIFLSPYL